MKNRIITCLIFILPLLIIFSSCKKDETLTPTDITEKYVMTAGTNAADLFRFNFFKRYQTKILFDFEKKDYWYALSDVTSTKDSIDFFRFVTDTAKQRRAVEFLNAQCFLFYPQAFKQTWLPQYIFAVDRLGDYNSTGSSIDSLVYFKTNSFNNITAAGLGNRLDTMSVATKTKLRNDLNFGFLYNWVYMRNKNFFPKEFFDISALKYDISPRDSVSTVYNDYLKNGFLPPTASYPGYATTSRYQSQDADVAQFLRMIIQQNDAFVTTTITNVNADKVKAKYQLLVNYFTSLGINIRAINTANISTLGPLDIY